MSIDANVVTTSLSPYVALVQLELDDDLAARARSDGSDLAFATLDGSRPLPHELVRFDHITGALIAWVRLDEIDVVTGAAFFLYFAGPDTGPQSDPAATWGAEARGVWHFEETPSGNGSMRDSSPWHNDGTPLLMSSGNQDVGVVGSALFFEGEQAQQSVDCGNDPSLDLAAPLTTIAWIALADSDYNHYTRILNKKGNWNDRGGYDIQMHPAMNFYESICSGSTSVGLSGVNLSTATWHQVGVVHDGSTVRLYLDGAVIFSASPNSMIRTGGSNLQIGSIGGRGYDFFFGRIDEVRVFAEAKSAGFFAADYSNVSAPTTFLHVGSLEHL